MDKAQGNGSDIKQEYLLSLYEVESIISNKNDTEIAIVKHSMSGCMYIRKTISDCSSYQIYMQLKEKPHKNLAKIEEIIVRDGKLYVIQELVIGTNLKQLLDKEKVVDRKKAIEIMIQLCDVLEHLHTLKSPIIHRDIKPSNIMIEADGTIKLIDFDAARNYKIDMPKDTQHLGTEGYASPEQFGYMQTDSRSDIFASGILFHEILTGKMKIDPSGPEKKLLSIINKCTKMDPKERYQSASDMKKALYKAKKGKMSLALGGAGVVVCSVVIIMGIHTAQVKDTDNFEMIKESQNLIETQEETTVALGEMETSDMGIFEPVDNLLPINLKEFYEKDNYAWDLLENELIDRKMKVTLGNQYSYFEECLHSIDYVSYYEDTQSYYMEGGVPGLYTIMEACVVVYQNGEVEAAFLCEEEIYYFSSMKQEKKEIHAAIFNWIDRHGKNPLHIEEEIHMEGIYINPENHNYLKIQRDNLGYFMELEGTFGANVGGVEEYLQHVNENIWGYFPDENQWIQIVFAEDMVLVFEKGTFGGLGVEFTGQYYKN